MNTPIYYHADDRSLTLRVTSADSLFDSEPWQPLSSTASTFEVTPSSKSLSISHSLCFPLQYLISETPAASLSLLFRSALSLSQLYSVCQPTVCPLSKCSSIFRRNICYQYLPITHWLPFHTTQPTYRDWWTHSLNVYYLIFIKVFALTTATYYLLRILLRYFYDSDNTNWLLISESWFLQLYFIK